MPRVSVRAVQQALEWKKFPHRMPPETYFELPDRVRASLAKLLGASRRTSRSPPGNRRNCRGRRGPGLASAAAKYSWPRANFPRIFPHFYRSRGRQAARKDRGASRRDISTAGGFSGAYWAAHAAGFGTSLVRFDNAARWIRRAWQALVMRGHVAAARRRAMRRSHAAEDRRNWAPISWRLGLQMAAGALRNRVFLGAPEAIERMRPAPAYWMAFEDADKFHTLSAREFPGGDGARRWDSPETAKFFNLCGTRCVSRISAANGESRPSGSTMQRLIADTIVARCRSTASCSPVPQMPPRTRPLYLRRAAENGKTA